MIGVSPAAALAGTISLLGPMIEKARWIDVVPEYNPFKYNSFPANAGAQTSRLTAALDRAIDAAASDGRISRMPPVLAFQSIVDTTVSTPAVAYELLDRLPAGRNELVLFDLNRQSGIDAFTRPEAMLPRLVGQGTRPYAVTLVTNDNAGTMSVSAHSVAAGADVDHRRPARVGVAGRHVFPLARGVAVSRGRSDLWRRRKWPRHRKHFARPAEPARRKGRARSSRPTC